MKTDVIVALPGAGHDEATLGNLDAVGEDRRVEFAIQAIRHRRIEQTDFHALEDRGSGRIGGDLASIIDAGDFEDGQVVAASGLAVERQNTCGESGVASAPVLSKWSYRDQASQGFKTEGCHRSDHEEPSQYRRRTPTDHVPRAVHAHRSLEQVGGCG